jgi:glycine cleavage system H protein
MTIPEDRLYTREHEWAKVEGSIATVGISDYAQRQLGEVVYVELPEVGTEIEQGEPFGSVESVKSTSELFAPFTGRIAAVNDELEDNPGLVNDAPYGEGWMIRIQLSDPSEAEELLGASDYEELTGD